MSSPSAAARGDDLVAVWTEQLATWRTPHPFLLLLKEGRPPHGLERWTWSAAVETAARLAPCFAGPEGEAAVRILLDRHAERPGQKFAPALAANPSLGEAGVMLLTEAALAALMPGGERPYFGALEVLEALATGGRLSLTAMDRLPLMAQAEEPTNARLAVLLARLPHTEPLDLGRLVTAHPQQQALLAAVAAHSACTFDLARLLWRIRPGHMAIMALLQRADASHLPDFDARMRELARWDTEFAVEYLVRAPAAQWVAVYENLQERLQGWGLVLVARHPVFRVRRDLPADAFVDLLCHSNPEVRSAFSEALQVLAVPEGGSGVPTPPAAETIGVPAAATAPRAGGVRTPRSRR